MEKLRTASLSEVNAFVIAKYKGFRDGNIGELRGTLHYYCDWHSSSLKVCKVIVLQSTLCHKWC